MLEFCEGDSFFVLNDRPSEVFLQTGQRFLGIGVIGTGNGISNSFNDIMIKILKNLCNY